MLALPVSAPPIARTSLADSVYDTLLQAIVSGQLPSGTELKTVALAERLEVSRTPVQEALHRLAADGLVDCPTGRRARVARFLRGDVAEIYALRKLLEGEAASLAAERMDPAAVAELRRRIVSLLASSDEVGWPARALDCDAWFHEQLAGAAGNGRLKEDIQRHRMLIRSFCRMVGTVENLRQAASEHLAIVDALERRNPSAARAAMHAHVDARLASVLREAFPPEA